MNEVREYKASIFRKSFNITSLVLNIFHFCLAYGFCQQAFYKANHVCGRKRFKNNAV